MKILASKDYCTFIAEVTKSEIESVFSDLTGNRKPSLKIEVGQDIDLSAGAKFHAGVKDACRSMEIAVMDFKHSRDTFAKLVSLLLGKPAFGYEQESSENIEKPKETEK